jgi:hypothetical protein
MTTALATSKNDRFVVEHDGLGKWRRGDVVTTAQIEAEGGDLERLLGTRCMRAATELEYGQTHVDLPNAQTALSYQHVLAEKDLQIARLTNRVRELEEEKANRHQGVTNQAPPQHEAALIEEKDRLIHTLQAKIKSAEGERLRGPEHPPAPAPTTPTPARPRPQG